MFDLSVGLSSACEEVDTGGVFTPGLHIALNFFLNLFFLSKSQVRELITDDFDVYLVLAKSLLFELFGVQLGLELLIFLLEPKSFTLALLQLRA